MNWVERLKKKWNIANNWDFTAIMIVFSLAGMGVTFSRRAIFKLLGINHMAWWVNVTAWLILIVPLYQISTLFFSLFLGQFNFFWGRQKAMGRAIKRRFTQRAETQKPRPLKV